VANIGLIPKAKKMLICTDSLYISIEETERLLNALL